MDKDRPFLLRREAGRFGRLTAGFFRVFKPHLVGKNLEGFELVHVSIIEQIF